MTTTVLAFVITDGGPLVVGLAVVEAVEAVEADEVDEDELEVVAELALELGLPLPGTFPTELSVPVKYTDQVFDPPPTVKSVKRSVETLSIKAYTCPCQNPGILCYIANLRPCLKRPEVNHRTNNLILLLSP